MSTPASYRLSDRCLHKFWRLLSLFSLSAAVTSSPQAGTYDSTYTAQGCTVTVVGPNGQPWQHGYSAQGYSGGDQSRNSSPDPEGGVTVGPGSVTCSGAIHVILTWKPSFAGELPPSVVVITKYAIASYSGTSGSVSNGLGDAAVPNGQYGKISAGTHYEVLQDPPNPIEFDITPAAFGSLPSAVFGAPPAASGNVMVDCFATPVTIQSNYAVRSGNSLCFLIGQEADFFVSDGGFPSSLFTYSQHVWRPGHSCIDGVELGALHLSPHNDGETLSYTYRDFRRTQTLVQDLNAAHPSWYYHRTEQPRGVVSCSVQVSAAGQIIGSANVKAALKVFTPSITGPYPKAGPTTIQDTDPQVSIDDESARAGTRNPGAAQRSGFRIVGLVELPTLFRTSQRDGFWSYVQTCRRTWWYDYGGASVKDWGLDNSYPYGGSYLRDGQYHEFDWHQTSSGLLVRFTDSPSLPVTSRFAYSDGFEARAFYALEPPTVGLQTAVAVPFYKVTWSYYSVSNRNGTMWEQVGAYRSYDYVDENAIHTLKHETTPLGAGVQKGAETRIVPSSEMDWEQANLNG